MWWPVQKVSETSIHGSTLRWRWVHTCNVTTYRNTVSWQCERDSWPRNVSKVGYAVTLRAFSVCSRYLAVDSKGWYSYGLSRSGRATWHVTTVRSSHLLAPVTNWEPHGVTLAGYCYGMRHGMKVQIVTPYCVSHLQRYGVTVRGNVTRVYLPLDHCYTASGHCSCRPTYIRFTRDFGIGKAMPN
jgi:hypothetical protein